MHNYKINSFALLHLMLLAFIGLPAQENDLLAELNELNSEEVTFESPAFKALQIGNLQSTKIVAANELYMVVAHRFGSVKGGIQDFYGLDQANTKIQLLYGLFNNLQVSISRDSYEKTYSGALKYGLLKQSSVAPLSIVYYTSIDINTLLSKIQYPTLVFYDRMAYSTQILIAKRFSSKLSVELAPTYVRQNFINLNYTKANNWNQYLLALGGRYKFTKRMSINMDYAYNFSKSNASLYFNPLTIGVDIETGGHVFQLLFTNSRASNDAAFLTETLGEWSKGDISFGFNIVRVF